MGSLLMERLHLAKGLDPVADAFAATVASDVINCENLERVLFVVYDGVGTTGSSTFTVEACDDVVPTTTSAFAYRSREITTGDTEGAFTDRAAAGYVNRVGSSKILLYEVDTSLLAASGYGYVRLKAVESVDSPVLGAILVIGESREPGASKTTVIV